MNRNARLIILGLVFAGITTFTLAQTLGSGRCDTRNIAVMCPGRYPASEIVNKLTPAEPDPRGQFPAGTLAADEAQLVVHGTDVIFRWVLLRNPRLINEQGRRVRPASGALPFSLGRVAPEEQQILRDTVYPLSRVADAHPIHIESDQPFYLESVLVVNHTGRYAWARIGGWLMALGAIEVGVTAVRWLGRSRKRKNEEILREGGRLPQPESEPEPSQTAPDNP